MQAETQIAVPSSSITAYLTKLARKILRDGDMSPEVLRSESEIEDMKEQMQQQQALQQVAQQFINQNQNPNNETQN